MINQGKVELSNEVERLKAELETLHSKYDLVLETTDSFFVIFENSDIIEFSPKAADKFVFPSDFSDKTLEEVIPLFQTSGEKSSKIIQDQISNLTPGFSPPFDFEFLDKNGVAFGTSSTISELEEERFLIHFEIKGASQQSIAPIPSGLETAPVLIKHTDIKQNVIFLNEKWLELLGGKQGESYSAWKNCIHTDDKAEYYSTVEYSSEQQKKYEFTFRFKDQQGNFHWLIESGTPRISEDNKFLGYVSAAIDITARKSLEEETSRDKAITESEQKIQDSLDESEVVALTTNTDGDITFCNQQLLLSLGLKKIDIVGSNIFDLFIPDPGLNINQKKYSQMAQRGDIKGALSGKFFNQKKEDINVRFNVIFIKDALNEVSAVNLIGENVTDQKLIKKQLEKSNDQLTELFDNSYDLIQTFDHEGKFQFVNQAWIEKLGYAEQIQGLKFKDLVDPEHWPTTVNSLDRLIKGETIDRFETVFISEHGKKIFVSGRVNCSFDINGNAQFRGIFYDITERIRAEKAQSLYYKIAAYNIEGLQLNTLYSNLYKELNDLLHVKNLSIELQLAGPSSATIPYTRSEFDKLQQLRDQAMINKALSKEIQDKTPQQIIYEEEILDKIKKIHPKLNCKTPKVWLGVQIVLGNQHAGILSIHSYHDRSDFGTKDLELLYFIGSQISLAIERKLNEEKIIDQAARMKAIFESSSHQIWSVDNQYNLTAFNQNYALDLEEHYGMKAVLGEEYANERKKINPETKIFWENKYNLALQGNPQNFEYDAIANGKKIWSEVYINPIVKKDKTIDQVSVISNDITEKKSSALALSESETKFREIFESIQDIYFRCDTKGKVSMISPYSFESLGLKPEDTIGKQITSFFDSDIAPIRIYKMLQRQHKVHNLEISYSKNNGDRIDFICNINVVRRENKVVGFEGVARDITKIKQTNIALRSAKELAEKSLAIKEQFLANMSHEIRTPMNGIIGMIDLIGSTALDTEQDEYVQIIRKSSQTLLDILNDILDLSKIEAGKMQLKKKPIQLENTFQKLYNLFYQEAEINHITLSYNLAKNIPEVIMADETRLLQILSNLVSNAIKFSNKNATIDISLVSERIAPNTHSLKVMIKDEGIGIPSEQIENLFINFNQLDVSSSKTYAGTGLGLAISKELVTSMGGNIGVVSTPGLGSTFWFTFEAEERTIEQIESPEEEGHQIKLEFTTFTPKILVVDDNKVNRTVASQILIKSGCMVDQVESGKLALEKVINHSYDLIFMDIQMPEMDGIETTKHIKSLDLKDLPPIVAMTAYSMEEDKKKFMAQGLDDYLAKPIRAITIINKVKELLDLGAKEDKSKIKLAKKEIINLETIEQIAKFGGAELMKSIMVDFETEAEELIEHCLTNYQANEVEEIRKDLHTLKGSAGTLGIEQVEDLVIKLEFQLKSADTTNLKAQLDAIVSAFNVFKNNYKNILQM